MWISGLTGIKSGLRLRMELPIGGRRAGCRSRRPGGDRDRNRPVRPGAPAPPVGRNSPPSPAVRDATHSRAAESNSAAALHGPYTQMNSH